jgi:OmpA-OmpF porin, OOP family
MFSLIYANGGPDTTKGSLMEKNGVNLTLHREDSNSQMKADLLACAKQLHDGEKTCSTGAEAIVVMGDSGGQWLADLNPQLKKLGPEYQAVIIGAVGRSNGEDALLGPAEWKSNPQSMKGKTVVGVIRDGDWNIALNYLGSNGLKNNPDLKTWDPDAVNWIAAPDEDYIKAVTEVFHVPNRCEDRKVVKDGRPTGETKNVCPDGVVTWTPGDEQAVHGRPGTTKIVSSHEYASQMPAVILGIKKFFNDNRDEVSGLLAASFQAADQVKAFDAVRRKAGEMSAKLYNDQNGDYWYKYYPGFRDPKSGQMLGGSAVFGLEDNVNYFGLDGKHNNNMRATYETFGKIATHELSATLQGQSDSALQGSGRYLVHLWRAGVAEYQRRAGRKRGDGGLRQGSQSGRCSATRPCTSTLPAAPISPCRTAFPRLNELKDSLAINSQLALQIDGYTDNAGSDAVNVPLSEKRAQAVKRYFQQVAPLSFPDSRFKPWRATVRRAPSRRTHRPEARR